MQSVLECSLIFCPFRIRGQLKLEVKIHRRRRTQGVTDPSGNQSSSEYDDHGNVIRSIKTVKDASGAVVNYVVALSEYDYAEAGATDDDDHGNRPMVNVLLSAMTAEPFVVPADHAGDVYLDSDQLVSAGYLHADGSGNVYWASKQSFNPYTRELTDSYTLRSDGVSYDHTSYGAYVMGNPTSVTSPSGASTSNTYDATTGELKSSTDAAGTISTFVYSGDTISGVVQGTGLTKGLLLSTTRNGTSTSANTYYTASNTATGAVLNLLASSLDDTTGLTTLYTYYPDGTTKTVSTQWTDATATVHIQSQGSTTYDALGRATGSTDANGHTTTTTYDLDGKVTDTTDVYGGVTHNVYNAMGQLIQTIYPDGTETRSTYDAQGRAQYQSDRYYTGATTSSTADNTTTTLATFTLYDSQGNVIGSRRYSGVVITVTPDTAAGIPSGIKKSALSTQGTLLSATSTVLDALGRVAESIDPSGLRTGSVYYDNGQVHYTGPLKSTAPLGGPYQLSDFASYTTYAYESDRDHVTDALGHEVTTVRDIQGREKETQYPGNISTYTQYDPDSGDVKGTHVRHIDQLNRATDDYYDLAGQLTDVYLPPVDDATTESTDLVRPHWSYAYDANGNETAQIDPKGNVTTWVYNNLNQQTSRTLPGTESESFTYDSFGRQATHTDFNGTLATYTYYSSGVHIGALQSIVYTRTGKPTQTSSYTYDNLGRIATTTDDSGMTTNHYDAQGNLSEVDTPEGDIHYVYSAVTGQHTETYTDNTDTVYNYDDMGRLWHVKVTKLNGTILPAALITSYTYDDLDDKKTETLPNGDVTTYDYDALNRLTAVATTLGSTTLFSQTYVLNDDGTKASVDEHQRQPDGTTITTHTAWTYDYDQRLTDETYTSSVTGQGCEDAFAFDLAGNRVREDINGGESTAGGLTIRYTYNNDNQLTDEIEKNHAGSTVYETIYTYDANGSLTQSVRTGAGAETDTYGYDLRNRMTSSTVGGVTGTDIYRDDDIRVSQSIGSTTTKYLIDDNNPTGQPRRIRPVPKPAAAPPTGSNSFQVPDRRQQYRLSGTSVGYPFNFGLSISRPLTTLISEQRT